jgi:hypothetical protein
LINKILESRISFPPILVGGIGIQSIAIKNQNDKLRKVKFLKGIKLSGILPSIREVTKVTPKVSKTIKK